MDTKTTAQGEDKHKLRGLVALCLGLFLALACDPHAGDKEEETTHSVTFNSKGGSPVAAQYVAHGGRAKMPSPPPQKEANTFGGWYRNAASSSGNQFDFRGRITASVTLYAKWTSVQHTVTFASEGGSLVAAVMVAPGGRISAPTLPSKEAHSFGGWYTKPSSSSGGAEFDFSSPITASFTLYAKWTRLYYTVSFNDMLGTHSAAQVAVGQTVAPPAEPHKDAAHAFIGWYINAATASRAEFDFSREITADLMLYARYRMIVRPADKTALKQEIFSWIMADPLANLNHIDTSKITDMQALFIASVGTPAERAAKRAFNGKIDKWQTHNVTDMSYMFVGASSFNRPLNGWDTSSVTSMQDMFDGASSFNQPLDRWRTKSVADMRRMFNGASSFDQPLNSWDTSSVSDMSSMFAGASSFDQPLEKWRTANVTTMANMFENASRFTQDLSQWQVGKVAFYRHVFRGSSMFDSAHVGLWPRKFLRPQP